MIGSVPGPDGVVCSRADCRSGARWNVNWRNPRIHGPERVKVWLACDDHRAYLQNYLQSRDFPVVVTPLGETVDRVGAPIPSDARSTEEPTAGARTLDNGA